MASSIDDLRARFEKDIARLPKSQQRYARVAFETKMAREAMRARQEGRSGVGRQRGPLGAALFNALDTYTFGLVPRAARGLGAERAASVYEGIRNASQEEYPGASLVGALGPFFMPRIGGPSAIAAAGGNLASRLTGTQRLAARAPELGQRALEALGGGVRGHMAEVGTRAAAHIANAATTGAGAIAAISAAENIPAADFRHWLTSTADAVRSPQNIALTALSGGVSARLQASHEQARLRLAREMQRRGVAVTPDFLTNSEELSRLFSASRYLPGLITPVNRFVREHIHGPMWEWVREFAGKPGARAAARALRDTAGTERSVIGGDTAGRVTTRRHLRADAAFGAHGPDTIAKEEVRTFVRLIQTFNKQRRADPTIGQRGGELAAINRAAGKAIGLAAKSGRGKTLTIQQAENLRQAYGKAADFHNPTNPLDPNTSDATRREARQLYTALSEMIASREPAMGRAMRTLERLRRQEEAMSDVRMPRIGDRDSLDALWRAKDIRQKWITIRQNSTPEEIAAYRADYLGKAVQEMTIGRPGQEALSGIKWRKAGYEGEFEPAKFDFIMGSKAPRQELEDIVTIFEAYNPLIAPEGSATAGRAVQFAIVGVASALPLYVNQLLENPWTTTAGLLGAVGARALILSVLAGSTGRAMSAMATRGPAPAVGMQTLPPAIEKASEFFGPREEEEMPQ